MNIIHEIVKVINYYLTDYVISIILIAIGLWYSIKTRFVQVRFFKEGIKKVFGNFDFNAKADKTGMNSFQALTTAIAGQVGTGNIVGASGAILTGGPGAIFWMWIIAFLGMSTIYAEAILAQKTRRVGEKQEILGGPVYYIKEAFKGKTGTFLASFFAVATIIALGSFGAMVQSNSISATLNTAFKIPTYITGIVLVILCISIFIGGSKRVAEITEKIVPIMAFVFIFFGLILIIIRIKYIPATFGIIIKYAFTPNAIIGGGIGTALKLAISQGAKRGIFSNEAGMGSTPHAHAQANVKDPHDQGCVAMIGVFIDTFVVLTLNALIVISTLYTHNGILSNGYSANIVNSVNEKITSSNLVQTAFGTVFGYKFGSIFVAICLFFFAFSTIISWNLYAKINVIYLFGEKAAIVFQAVAILSIFVGTLASNDFVWDLVDLFNYLMVIPNTLALIVLTKIVLKAIPNRQKIVA